MSKKYKIVFLPFPFDDLSSYKVRPDLCLTDELTLHNQVVVAFISSKINTPMNNTNDVFLDEKDNDFNLTGLKKSSTIILHKLITISSSIFNFEIGKLPEKFHNYIDNKLKQIFQFS